VHVEVKLFLVEGSHAGDPPVRDLRLEDPGVVEEEAEKRLQVIYLLMNTFDLIDLFFQLFIPCNN
jgi:hypothetical protein